MFESSDKQRVADILLQCLLILFIRMDCSTDTKSKRKDLVVFACICDESALLFICRMDGNSCFKLEIQIVAPNCRGSWYSLDKFVDADFTNFKDLVDEVVDKCPPNYGDMMKNCFTHAWIQRPIFQFALIKIWLKCLQNIKLQSAAI